MANSILVLGNSGEGKSSSLMPNSDLGIKGLDPKETFLINVKGKPLPAKGWVKMYTPSGKDNPNGNMLSTTNSKLIVDVLKALPSKLPHIKNVVIDDANYLMSQQFMDKSGEAGYQKFTDIAKSFFDIINAGIMLPSDYNFIVIAHTEIDSNNSYKLKTIGKLLDEKINIQGLFTYCIVSSIEIDFEGNTNYGYFTNTTRDSRGITVPAKTPYGVFDKLVIPNDLGYVIDEINKYNNGE